MANDGLGLSVLLVLGMALVPACRCGKDVPKKIESVASAAVSTPVASASVVPARKSTLAPVTLESSGCYSDMVKLGAFCIDKFEASLWFLDDEGIEVQHPHYERPVDGKRYVAHSVEAAFPQGYISRVESEAACKNSGKRLCKLAEWRRGCGGKRNWTYPYAAAGRRGMCNNGKSHLLSKLFGTNGRAWKYDDFNSPKLNQEPGFLAKSGAYAGCANEEGVFDFVGNLHEWVDDSVTTDFVDRMKADGTERREQPWREGNGMFAGGFFSTTSELGPGCKFLTIAHEPSYHDYSTGFRCCKDASKSSGK